MTKKIPEVITLPHASLRKPSVRIGLIDADVIKLVDGMTAAALDWEKDHPHENTVGLAAVQINVNKRVVIIREDFEDHNNQNFIPLINPEIKKYFGKVTKKYEGCLSVKKFYSNVPRYEKVKVVARNIEGEVINFTASGFLARIVQHEVDHVKGITIVDRADTSNKATAFKILESDKGLEKVSFKTVSDSGILEYEDYDD